MNKFCAIFLSIILINGFSACKKEAKPQVPAALVGKWYLRQYSITASINGVAGAPYITPYNDTATNVYYQFNSDGSGLEQTNVDPNYFTVPPDGFTYRVSGSSIIFSHNSTLMNATTCSFAISGNNLVISGTYSDTGAGGTVSNLQQITLIK